MNSELISVIIPVYNSEKYLDACLQSVISQTHNQMEIIVVNDESTDNSFDIISKFAKEDSRIKVINKKNGGISSSRNAGLKASTGAFVGFIDSDDCVSTDYFEKLYTEIIATNADMCMCGYEREGKSLFITTQGSTYTDFGYAFYQEIRYSQVVWAKLYRKEIIDGLYFDETKRVGEDDLFITEVLARCKSVASVGEALYHYTINYQGATLRKFDQRKIDILPVFTDKLKIVSDNWPKSVAFVLKNAVDYFITIHIEYGIRKLYRNEQFKERLLHERENLYTCFLTYRNSICDKDLDKINFYYNHPGRVLLKDRVRYQFEKRKKEIKRVIKSVVYWSGK